MDSEHNEPNDTKDQIEQLLEELRVILPGVEILFAFLLTVPFSNRFAEVTVEQQYTYFVAFLSAAIAVIFLIAPSMLHRIQLRPHSKERFLRTSTWFAILGTGCLAIAITAVVLLITELIFGANIGVVFAAGVAGLAVWLWFGFPLLRRRQSL